MHAATYLVSQLLILTLLPPLILGTDVTLSVFQPISGFSQSCNKAYNTPLTKCQPSDFSSGQCSQQCINSLDALTQTLNEECVGTSASPNTLIAAFFYSQGTETLCPNKISGSEGSSPTQGGGNTGGDSSQAADSSDLPGVLGHQGAAASVTYAKYSFSAVPPSTTSKSKTSSTSSTSSSTQTPPATATVTPEAPNPTNVSPNASPPSSSSRPSSATPTSTSRNGGGGTILDIGSNGAARNKEDPVWALWLLFGSVVMLYWI